MSVTVTDRKLDTREAAEYVGLSPATLVTDRCTRRMKIPHLKLGKRVLYRQSDLDAWIESRVVRG
jgi:excisionase family DNA binding protein